MVHIKMINRITSLAIRFFEFPVSLYSTFPMGTINPRMFIFSGYRGVMAFSRTMSRFINPTFTYAVFFITELTNKSKLIFIQTTCFSSINRVGTFFRTKNFLSFGKSFFTFFALIVHRNNIPNQATYVNINY